MTNIDFIELAIYCQNRYKEEHNSDKDRYVKTLFVAITKEGDILTSTTPHVLRDAEQCILIHERSTLALTNHYLWYHVEFINMDGIVLDERFDEQFTLHIGPFNGFSNQIMWFNYNNQTIYSCKKPWENTIGKVWKLYTRVKDLKSTEEIKLIASLFERDEKILELEKQIEDFKFTKHLLEQEKKQYKLLLDELKQIIDNVN